MHRVMSIGYDNAYAFTILIRLVWSMISIFYLLVLSFLDVIGW
jgi:hypothetical protein